jgi:hypothetical protein
VEGRLSLGRNGVEPHSGPGLGNPDPLGYADTAFSAVAAVAPGDAWIVGYTSFLGTPQTLVEHWNGSQWIVVPSPVVTLEWLAMDRRFEPGRHGGIGIRRGRRPQRERCLGGGLSRRRAPGVPGDLGDADRALERLHLDRRTESEHLQSFPSSGGRRRYHLERCLGGRLLSQHQ